MTTSPHRTPRSRRTSEEIRALILDAAGDLFAEQGYDATTTKDIAERARVSERLLFSNFGSKDELFDVVVIAPFSEVIAEYVASWEHDTPGDTPESRIRYFVEGLYELADRNRAVLRSALARPGGPGGRAEHTLLDHLAATVQSMQDLSESVRETRGYRIDAAAAVAAATAMVFGMALLDDLIFPAGTTTPSRQRLTAEMTAMILHGVQHRDEDATQNVARPG